MNTMTESALEIGQSLDKTLTSAELKEIEYIIANTCIGACMDSSVRQEALSCCTEYEEETRIVIEQEELAEDQLIVEDLEDDYPPERTWFEYLKGMFRK